MRIIWRRICAGFYETTDGKYRIKEGGKQWTLYMKDGYDFLGNFTYCILSVYKTLTAAKQFIAIHYFK